jgi:hypothetical protein
MTLLAAEPPEKATEFEMTMVSSRKSSLQCRHYAAEIERG